MNSKKLKQILLEYVLEHGPDELMNVPEELNNIADPMDVSLTQDHQEENDNTIALSPDEENESLSLESSNVSEDAFSNILADDADAIHTIHLETPMWSEQAEEHNLSLDEIETFQALHGTNADSTEYSTHTHIVTYAKQKNLGQGGMGEVWQVTDPELNRSIALKIMHEKYASDDNANEDFDEETQINAQLQHPGIVPVYSFERLESGIRYLTMKEIEGQTLKEVIRTVHLNIHNPHPTTDGWNIRRLVDVYHSVVKLWHLHIVKV